MTDSLFSILSGKNFDEPPEVASIKKYVKDTLRSDVSVQIREKDIVIIAANAALANTLRLRGPDMKRRCQLEKRVIIRIA